MIYVNSSETGGYEFIRNNLGISVPYIIIEFLIIICGSLGNLLLAGSILISHKLRNNATFILILNLAFSELAISSITVPFMITGINK